MTIAILCFKSEWLQMRVNTGYIFGGLLILSTVVIWFVFRKRENVFNSLFTAGNLIVCSLIGFIMYGAERTILQNQFGIMYYYSGRYFNDRLERYL